MVNYSRSSTSTRKVRLSAVIVLFSLLLSNPALPDERKDKEKEFESVRSQIKIVKTKIKSAEDDIEQMLAELQKHEIAATDATNTLTEINSSITAKKKRLSALNDEFNSLDKKLEKERKLLSEQVQAVYQAGRGNYIKLLLNQEDPAMIGRILAYHNYYNQVRIRRINDVASSLEQLKTLQYEINEETEKLILLHSDQETRLEEFNSYRQDRREALARLRSFVNDQDRQLQTLQKTERALARLFDNLKRQAAITEKHEDAPPFISLKGKLTWPVRGKIRTRYGTLKKGGKLKSRGVTFEAEAGTRVHAISTGKVVYADWFRNLGLLLILDHGDGFMSLYGHNESLLKKPGDWVEKGNPIAKTGDTGGQQYTGLYFEIRQGGNPLNPSLWCRS